MNSEQKNRLLRIRAQKKKRRPAFVRVESWRYKRLGLSWRHPKGIDSKTRRKSRSGVKMPNVGYGVPTAIKGLHPSGLEDVLIFSIKDLEILDPKVHGIRISARIGAKKRIKIVEAAYEKNFKILNTSLMVEKEEEEGEIEAVEVEKVEGVEGETEETAEGEEDEGLSMKQKHIRDIKNKLKEKENKGDSEEETSEETEE